MCECLTARWLLKQELKEKWDHVKGWESAIPPHQGLDEGIFKSCWWLLPIPSSGLVSQPTTSKTWCCVQMGTVPNLGISEECSGGAGKGQSQDLCRDLRMLWIIPKCPARDTLKVTETICNSHPGNAALGCIQLFLSGMGSSSSKRQSLSGQLKSNLITKNGTKDQISANSKKCRQLVRKQTH